MVRSSTKSGWSAATPVKTVSPEIALLALGQGVVCSEASIVTGARRRVCYGVPGSWVAAGHPTDCIGTWEGRIACLLQQAEKARRGHGDAVVGSAHSRGVVGVTPGAGPAVPDPLEGADSQSLRVQAARAIHRDGYPGVSLCPRIATSPLGPRFHRGWHRPLGKEMGGGIGGLPLPSREAG